MNIAQIDAVLRRYPDAKICDGVSNFFPKIVHIEKYPLSEMFNKWHTNLWIPIPISFPHLGSDGSSGYPFHVYTDADLRHTYGGFPHWTQPVSWSQGLGKKDVLEWLGVFWTWNFQKDGLYTWMMVLKQCFSKSAPYTRKGTLWE